jgi:hypothetical protein
MEQAAELGVFGALKRMTEVFSGWLPILVLVSLTAGVWLYYLLVSRHEPQHRTLMECVRRFLRFESLLWPIVGRVLYLSFTVFLILTGLMTTILVNFFSGLVGTVLLLVLLRILFEMSMVLFTMHAKLMSLAFPLKETEQARPDKKKDVTRALRDVVDALPDEPVVRKRKEPTGEAKPALSAEPLVQKAFPALEVELPLFSPKSVDKEDDPVLK